MQKSSVASMGFENPEGLTVFCAHTLIPCDGCQKSIESGEHFVRSGDKAGKRIGLRYVWCSTCRTVSESEL